MLGQSSLIRLYSSLGYSDSKSLYTGKGGLCNGATLRWLEACMLQQEEVFNNRFNKINQLNTLDIQEITQKVQAGQKPTQEDLKGLELLDLYSFFDSLDLYMHPMKHRSVFNAYHNQGDYDSISELASSDGIKERGGLKKIYSEPGIYNNAELINYLDEIRVAIEKSGCNPTDVIGVSLVSRNHAVGLTYQSEIGWKFMDIEQFPFKTYNSLSTEDIAKEINAAFQRTSPANFGIYYAINTSIVVTGNNPGLTQLKDNLEQVKQKHVLTEEIANRNEVINLAWLAAQNGYVDVINSLKEFDGIDFNKADDNGITPAYVAAQNAYIDVIDALWQAGANLNKKSDNNISPAYIAVVQGHANVLEKLQSLDIDLAEVNEVGDSLAHAAAIYNQGDDVIEVLVKGGVDLSKKNILQETPAYLAARLGSVNTLDALRAAGIDINAAIKDDDTIPLHGAAISGHANSITVLGEAGCNFNSALKDGRTAAFYAAANGHVNVIEVLRKHQAKLDIPFITTADNLRNFAKIQEVTVCARIQIIIDRQLKRGEKEGSISINPYDIGWIMGHKDVLKEMLKSEGQLSVFSSGNFAPDSIPDEKNPEYFMGMMNLVPHDQRLDVLKVIDKYGHTILHDVTEHPEFFKMVLELLPQNQRLDAMMTIDKKGESVIQVAVNNSQSFQMILTLFPEQDWLVYAKEKNDKDLYDSLMSNPSFKKDHQKTFTEFTIPNSKISLDNSPQDKKSVESLKMSSQDKLIGYKLQMFSNVRPDALITKMQRKISLMIESLAQSENNAFLHSSKSIIDVLSYLSDFLANKDDCWLKAGINPTTYGDIFEFWSNQPSNIDDKQLSNIEFFMLKDNISSSNPAAAPIGDAIKSMMSMYKDEPLPEVELERTQTLKL